MLPLERRPSAGFAIALAVLGHVDGWGFPRGGAQAIADGLAASWPAAARCTRPARSTSCRCADVVLADVVPAELRRIARLPERYDRALGRYRHGPGAFKLDWALDGPIPWRAPSARRAATVHLGGTFDEIAASERGAWTGRPVERPFVILAQHTLFDPSRAPEGKHTAWAYCHVPNGWRRRHDRARSRRRSSASRRASASSFSRGAVTTPADFEARNRNLVGGDINGGDDRPRPARGRGRCARRTPTGRRYQACTSARRRRRPAAACTGCAATRRR